MQQNISVLKKTKRKKKIRIRASLKVRFYTLLRMVSRKTLESISKNSDSIDFIAGEELNLQIALKKPRTSIASSVVFSKLMLSKAEQKAAELDLPVDSHFHVSSFFQLFMKSAQKLFYRRKTDSISSSTRAGATGSKLENVYGSQDDVEATDEFLFAYDENAVDDDTLDATGFLDRNHQLLLGLWTSQTKTHQKRSTCSRRHFLDGKTETISYFAAFLRFLRLAISSPLLLLIVLRCLRQRSNQLFRLCLHGK